MNIKTLITCILFGVAKISYSQGNWAWAANGGKGISMYSYSAGSAVGYDQNNNTYVVGTISSPAKIGTLNLNSYGSSDAFIAKYNQQGNLIWAKTAGGIYGDIAKTISIGSDGYLYVSGFVSDVAHFDNQTFTTQYQSFFLAKLDTNGNYKWIKIGTGAGVNMTYDPLLSVSTDNIGHVYLAGYCHNNSQLIDTTYYNATVGTAFFLTQLDTLGNLNWVRFVKGSSGSQGMGNTGIDLVIDQLNNVIYTAAIPRQEVSGSSITSYDNMILGKIAHNGNVIWEKEFGDTLTYVWGGHPKAISVDANDNIYVTGTYYKYFWLNSSSTGNGGFTAKFNNTNGNVISANSFFSSNGSMPMFSGCDYDYNGNVIFSGTFCGAINFGGISISPLSSNYDCDDFIASYDTTGFLNWAVRYGNGDYDAVRGSNSNHSMYSITGSFKDSVSFGTHTLYADTFSTSSDFYFVATMQLNETDLSVKVPNSNLYFSLFPNPASSVLTIKTFDSFSNYQVEIYSVSSALIKRYEKSEKNIIDVSDLVNGTYFITLKSDKASFVKKFVKVE